MHGPFHVQDKQAGRPVALQVYYFFRYVNKADGRH